ncbi:hypothetical protein J6TS2_30070 [Heyndrickxia sporothermodurans]|nr:hypothetical protein J6TS2_30070 [Heyndrickxia sporothermodurans]
MDTLSPVIYTHSMKHIKKQIHKGGDEWQRLLGFNCKGILKRGKSNEKKERLAAQSCLYSHIEYAAGSM